MLDLLSVLQSLLNDTLPLSCSLAMNLADRDTVMYTHIWMYTKQRAAVKVKAKPQHQFNSSHHGQTFSV